MIEVRTKTYLQWTLMTPQYHAIMLAIALAVLALELRRR